MTVAQITVSADSATVTKSADSKTIFLYRASDTAHLDELTAVITKNWKFNRIELQSFDAFALEDLKVNDLLFAITYNHQTDRTMYPYNVTHQTGPAMFMNGTIGPKSNFVSFYLTLTQKKDSGFVLISESTLSISGATLIDVSRTNKTSAEIIRNQYTNSTIFSWNFPYLGTVMNTVSTALEKGVTKYSGTYKYPGISTSPGFSNLKHETLYVSDAVEVVRNRHTGKEKIVNKQRMIDEAYDYPFEIVSTDALNELVTSGKKGYILMFHRRGTGKTIFVIDLSTMTIVYNQNINGQFKLKDKDIRKLNKVLSRSK